MGWLPRPVPPHQPCDEVSHSKSRLRVVSLESWDLVRSVLVLARGWGPLAGGLPLSCFSRGQGVRVGHRLPQPAKVGLLDSASPRGPPGPRGPPSQASPSQGAPQAPRAPGLHTASPEPPGPGVSVQGDTGAQAGSLPGKILGTHGTALGARQVSRAPAAAHPLVPAGTPASTWVLQACPAPGSPAPALGVPGVGWLSMFHHRLERPL